MGKSKNLLENEREQIVRLRKQSKTFTEIANIVNRSVTACKQAWYKFLKAGMYCDQPKNGKPRKQRRKWIVGFIYRAKMIVSVLQILLLRR